MPIDYSKWKDIEISDDEDDTHPNIDTPSLFRWRHQARLERQVETQKEKAQLQSGKEETASRVEEVSKKLVESSKEEEKEKLKEELQKLKDQEDEWRKKEEDLEHKEQQEKWNADTICQPGFSNSRINTVEKREEKQMTDEEKSQAMEAFFKENKEKLKKLGYLQKWEDTKTFILDNRELCHEFTSDYLTVHCLNLAIEGKTELSDHVAHQVITMQYLLELAKQLDYNPKTEQLITSFFTKIKKAEPQYKEMFEDELKGLKERVGKRAEVKRQEAIQEIEEEEKKEKEERIKQSPGGIDPVEVMESLPQAMAKCFEKEDIPGLQKVASEMNDKDFRYHLDRCVKSGLWVADAALLKGPEENITEEKEEKENDETELRQRKKPEP